MMEKLRKHKTVLLLSVLLILAAILRLYRVEEYMTFLGDEGRDMLVVYNMLHGYPTLLGPTASVGGFFMGPAYYYFITPFLFLFNYNPVGPAVMVALFGIATVWLIYKVGAEFFGKTAGFIAAFLYTISPLVLFYSRSSWNPNILPFFAVLTMYVLYKALVTKKLRFFLLSGILFGIDVQLHYVSLGLGIAIFFLTLIISFILKGSFIKRAIRFIKNGSVFFGGFLLGWSPFLAFEFRHEFTNLRNMFSFIFLSKEVAGDSNFWGNIWDVTFRLFGRLILNFPIPQDLKLFTETQLSVWTIGTLLLGGFALFFFFRDFYTEKKNHMKYILLTVWLFCGILFFGFYKKQIHDYYFTFLFPVPFLLVGHAWGRILALKKIPLQSQILRKGLFAVFLGIVILLSVNGWVFRNPPNQQKDQMQRIARFVYEKAGNQPYNFALITPGNSDHAYRYFLTLWQRKPTTMEPLFKDPERKTVTEQLFVICEAACEPLGNPLWEVAGFGEAKIAAKWQVPPVEVYKLIHTQ